MDDFERLQKRRRARRAALDRLGATNIYCICGESDPLGFEADHIYRREFDGTCWGICVKHHRTKSSWELSEHPKVGLYGGNPFEWLGHRHLGRAIYLEFCSIEERKDADLMFKLAAKGITFEI
jgi:hypothetical protein